MLCVSKKTYNSYLTQSVIKTGFHYVKFVLYIWYLSFRSIVLTAQLTVSDNFFNGSIKHLYNLLSDKLPFNCSPSSIESNKQSTRLTFETQNTLQQQNSFTYFIYKTDLRNIGQLFNLFKVCKFKSTFVL